MPSHGPPLFQSSPTPKGGCDVISGRKQSAGSTGFNPHPPRRAGATPKSAGALAPDGVSILTHPEGRVRRGADCAGRAPPDVSILTHPEGRVRRGDSGTYSPPSSSFQSSPTPKGGCDPIEPVDTERRQRVSILTHPEGRVRLWVVRPTGRLNTSFNPHPPRRAGATRTTSNPCSARRCFNPHPPRRAGAT